MSRSRHGHKHIGRAKCGVCTGTIGEAARRRERSHGNADEREGIDEYIDEHINEREELE